MVHLSTLLQAASALLVLSSTSLSLRSFLASPMLRLTSGRIINTFDRRRAAGEHVCPLGGYGSYKQAHLKETRATVIKWERRQGETNQRMESKQRKQATTDR